MALERARLKTGQPLRRTGSSPAGKTLAWVSVGLGLVLIWVAFELGQINAGHNRLSASQRESELRGDLIDVQQQNQLLRERIAVLETSEKVKAEAYRQVEDQLGTLQAEIQQQSEDLAFYRGIVGADQQAGLRVQNLEVVQGGEPGAFSLRMVLAQALRNDTRISGQVELALEGQQDGEALTLGLAELTSGAAARLDFSFRYFQNLQADVQVPAGFDPSRVTVRLLPRGKNRKDVEESFDWRPSAS